MRSHVPVRRLNYGPLAAVIVFGMGCSDDTAAPFVEDPIAPFGLHVSTFDETAGPTLAWAHDDDGQTRFVIEWWAGSDTGAEVTEIGSADRDARSFTDPRYRSDAVNNYRIRAEYSGTPSDATEIRRLDPRVSSPVNASLTRAAGSDSVAIFWNPPDFTNFDAFRVSRLLGREDDLRLDEEEIAVVEGSLEVLWKSDLPAPGEFGDRARYLLETRRLGSFSPPVVAGELCWQFPTVPIAVGFNGPETDAIALRHHPRWDRTTMTYEEDSRVVFEQFAFDASFSILTDITVSTADGTLDGAPLSSSAALVSHRTTAGEVSMMAFDRDAADPRWTVPVAADHLPAVAAGAAENSGYVGFGDTIVRVDGATGNVLDTIPLPNLIDDGEVVDLVVDGAAGFVLRRGEDGSSAPALVLQRVELDTRMVTYTRTLSVGDVDATLELSAVSDWIAVNYEGSGGVRSALLTKSTGAFAASTLAGPTETFSADGAHAIFLDATGRSVAARLGDDVDIEDAFGSENASACYVQGNGSLVLLRADGFVLMYEMSRQWSVPLTDSERSRPDRAKDITWRRDGFAHVL